MATITDQLQRIETLRQQIEGHGKLTPEILKRIEYRFRLECNYYSNRQEGGTLTREETRTVMVGNISVDKKPLKDILEMKGHDEAMTQILRIGRGEVNISEKRIKDIHREIIYEEYPEKQKRVGEWKTYYNEVINPKGEKYSFVLTMKQIQDLLPAHVSPNVIVFKYELKGFKKDLQHPFDIRLELRWRFDDYTYSFGFEEYGDSPGFTRYYHQYYSAEEINTIISQSGDLLVKKIEKNLERLNPK